MLTHHRWTNSVPGESAGSTVESAPSGIGAAPAFGQPWEVDPLRGGRHLASFTIGAITLFCKVQSCWGSLWTKGIIELLETSIGTQPKTGQGSNTLAEVSTEAAFQGLRHFEQAFFHGGLFH